MRRFIAVAFAAILLFGVTVQDTEAHWRPYKHWHYGSSYTYTNDVLGLWQVVSYYHVRLNGSSPSYIPSVQKTAPMECVVPYAILTGITITYCDLDRLTQYSPDRWRVTTRWRACLFGVLPVCTDHGQYLTFKATGYVTDRRTW